MAELLTGPTERSVLASRRDPPGPDSTGGADLAAPEYRPSTYRTVIAVFLAGLAFTAALTVASELGYLHSERKLTALQTRLTGLVLQRAVGQAEARLDRVVGLAAEAPDPAKVFREAMAPLMGRRGQFAASTLTRLKPTKPQLLAHLGEPLLNDLNPLRDAAVFAKGQGPPLATARASKGGVQRLIYLVSARGRAGTLVVGAAQQLQIDQRVTLPRSSPDANLNFAMYFGPTTRRSALIETSVSRLPLRGTVSQVTVPFGNHVITLVTSPRGSLAGAWAEAAPWAILVAGVLATLGMAASVERLLRRRALVEQRAALDRESLQRQRSFTEDLQRAMLPRVLPRLAGLDLAARYLPSARESQVGGDWYTAVAVDSHRYTFVVGDVSGHGIGAAGTMASLRYSTRAMARLGLSPSEMLERASAEYDMADEDGFATALVGLIDTASQELTLASSGHLPPLLLQQGYADFVGVPPGPPIGVTGNTPTPTTVSFEPGATLIAFTDGLVEKRGEPIDYGLERLARAATTASTDSAEAFISDVLSALHDPDHEDDIALFVVRFVGSGVVVLP